MDLFIYCANKYNYIAILRTHMELHTHTLFICQFVFRSGTMILQGLYLYVWINYMYNG